MLYCRIMCSIDEIMGIDPPNSKEEGSCCCAGPKGPSACGSINVGALIIDDLLH